MDMKPSFILIALVGINFISSVFCRRNVLLFLIPNLRSMFHPLEKRSVVTPNLDMLATESITFHNVYAQLPASAPSRTSLLTSRRPDTLQLHDSDSYWREKAGNYTTLPEYFKQNGYRTVSVGNVFHFGKSSNFSDDQPYSWSGKPFHPYTERYEHSKVCFFVNRTTLKFVSNLLCPVVPTIQPCKILPDMEIAIAAKAFIRATSKLKQEFFLTVGFHRPGIPFKFPVQYLDRYLLKNIQVPKHKFRNAGNPVLSWTPFNKFRDFYDIKYLNLSYPFGLVTDNYTALMKQNYLASVTYIDDLIGSILLELIVNSLYENTIIAITGVQGISLGERGMWGESNTNDVAIKVPLMIYVPDLTTSQKMRFRRVSNDLVELVDLFPTLVDLAELQRLRTCPSISSHVKLCTEGVNLTPIIEGYAAAANLSKVQAMEEERVQPMPETWTVPYKIARL